MSSGGSGRPTRGTRSAAVVAMAVVAAMLIGLLGGCSAISDDASGSATGSAGCDESNPPDLATGEHTLESGGDERIYRVQRPDEAGAEPWPLVMNIHGAGGSAVVQETLAGFGDRAATEGMVVVTPQAELMRGRSVGIWRLSPDGKDVRYLFDLLDEIEGRLCIDLDRVYLTGFSQGGILSLTMACLQPERFAGIAPVAGMVEIADCEREEPVPLIAFHGTDDESIGYDGRIAESLAMYVGYRQGPSVPELIDAWSGRNECAPKPLEEQISENVERITYRCGDDPVTLYTIVDGRHGWPGRGSAAVSDANASALIWDFFFGGDDQNP